MLSISGKTNLEPEVLENFIPVSEKHLGEVK